MDYQPLLPFAQTDRQKQIIEALVAHGSQRKAAKAIGVHKKTVEESLYRVRRHAARKGYSPDHDMVHTVPDGFKVKGTSSLYKDNGELSLQWVKSDIDKERQAEMMREAIAALSEEIPREKPAKAPRLNYNKDLLNCFVITDFHMGALSWEPETGADWDLDIAEETLINWFNTAIEMSPNAETALFAQISDLLHWDGFDAVTTASKHLLDADTRFPKLVRVAIRVIRRVIRMMLDKHKYLHIIMADANHDPASQVWLREWINVLYEDEPRVTVDTSPSPYNVYEFGDVALFTHHGHKRKPGNVSEVFAGKFREIFGRTKYAYAHMGHMHHLEVKENSLMIVEQHRTLAAPDAYAARGGYLSGRDAKVITYHKDYGEVSRATVSFDMVKKL